MSTRFEEFVGQFHQLDWYLFPIKAQRQLPIIIACLQKPAALRGFGNVFFTFEAFKQVKGTLLFCTNANRSINLIQSNHIVLDFQIFHIQVAGGGFSYFMVLRRL